MATMYISAEPFILRSSWINQYDGAYYIKTTKPSTAKHSALFATSAIPAGSVVQSAILKITRTTLIGGDFYANGVKNENLVDVTERITRNADGTFNDADVAFSFTGWGETGTEKPYGTRTAVANVKGATMEITYTEGQGVTTDKTAYRAAALASSREITMRGIIQYPDGNKQPITADNIINFSVNEGDDGGILIGAAPSAQIDLVLANADGEWLVGGGMRENRELIGARITIEIGLRVNGEFVFTPGGTFVIDEMVAEESTPTMTVRGYDEMANAFHAKYNDRNVYPASLSDILADIIGQSGFSQTGVLAANRVAMIPKKPDWGEECTLRQALAFVCGAGASFATMTRDGKVAIKPAWNDAEPLTLDPENYISLSIDERAFAFNRIVVTPRGAKEGKDDLVAYVSSKVEELPSNTIYMDDNPLIMKGWNIAQTIVNGIRDALKGAKWDAISTTWRGDPSVEVGTRVRLTNLSGKTIVSTVMAQGLDWENGFTMTASCSIPTKEVYTTGALTGAGMIDTKKIAVEGISNKHLETDSVTADKIKAGAITADKIDAGAITAEKIAAGVLSADLITAGSITTDKLAAGAVTADKIDAGAIAAIGISAGSITTDKLAAGAVTADKIAAGTIEAIGISAGSITTEKLHAGAVTADKIAANTITADSGIIADSAIGTTQIADGSITDAKIVSLTASKITAGTIDADKVNVVNLVADNITTGTINGKVIPELGGDKIAAGAISGVKVINGAISENKIAEGAVTAAKIVSSAITTDKLAANAVTANKILAGAITTDKLDANAVTADKIKAYTITANKLASDVGSSLDLSSNKAITTLVKDVGGKAVTFTQYNTPTGYKTGDIWVNTGNTRWQDISGGTWADVSASKWGEMYNKRHKTRVYNGKTWEVLADQGVIIDQETRINQTESKISLMATKTDLDGKVSKTEYKQEADAINMRVQTVEQNSGKAETVTNTAMTLDATGIHMKTGGTFTIDSQKFDINEKGQMSAADAIISGDLQVGGFEVWHKGDLVVSTATPPNPTNNMVWIKPDTSSVPAAGTWRHAQLDARPFKSPVDLALDGASIGAAPSGSTYTYEVSVPIFHSFNSADAYDCTVYLGASSGAQTINMGTQSIAKQGSGVYKFTATSSTWLGNSATIYIRVVMSNNFYLSVDSYSSISCVLTAKSSSAGAGWKNCTVQMYVQ